MSCSDTTYVRADLPELAATLAALTGKPHPLAISAHRDTTGLEPGKYRAQCHRKVITPVDEHCSLTS